MKNKFLITALCLIVGGFILAIVGFGLLNYNYEKLDLTEDFVEKHYDTTVDSLKEIDLYAINSKIKVGTSDDDQIHVTYYENDANYYVIDKTSTKLSVTNKRKFKFFTNILYMFQGFKENNIELLIELPQSYQNSLTLKSTNGDISLSDEMTLKDLSLININGKIEASNLNLDSIEVNGTNGGISLDTINAQKGSVSTTNSRIQVDQFNGKQLKVKSVNGRISFDDLISDTIDISVINGDIEGSIIGLKDDYSISIDKLNGKSNLSTQKVIGANKNLSISNINGSIQVTFIEK